mgnify:CR=1 FL=1
MRILKRVVGLEWAVTIAAAPLLTFPTVRPRWTVGALAVLAAFRATAFAVTDQRSLDLALVAFCLLGLAIAGVGILGIDWPRKAGLAARSDATQDREKRRDDGHGDRVNG